MFPFENFRAKKINSPNISNNFSKNLCVEYLIFLLISFISIIYVDFLITFFWF